MNRLLLFEGLGIRLKEEDRGRMFPVNDKAQTVVDTLLAQIRKLDVTIRTNARVADIIVEDGQAVGVALEDGQHIGTKALIIATGGKSVPHTGSTGDGYPWAKKQATQLLSFIRRKCPLHSPIPLSAISLFKACLYAELN